MSEYTEYPCVKIGGHIHITVTGSKCACGKEYDYEEKASAKKGTAIISSPLLWRTLSEVTCPECKNIMLGKDHAQWQK